MDEHRSYGEESGGDGRRGIGAISMVAEEDTGVSLGLDNFGVLLGVSLGLDQGLILGLSHGLSLGLEDTDIQSSFDSPIMNSPIS